MYMCVYLYVYIYLCHTIYTYTCIGHAETVKRLLRCKASVDLRNHDNVTALHNAVAFGHTVCVCVCVYVFVFACDYEVAAPTRCVFGGGCVVG